MGAWFRQWWNRYIDPALARQLGRTGRAMAM
jgi:hypothetical protein